MWTISSYTAKSVAEAVSNACADKNVLENELTYEVIEEKAGFLGIGASATIKAYCFKDVMDFTKDYLDTYFKGINMDVDIKLSIEDGRIKVMLNAENNAILIGKGGETLRSFNTVVRSAVGATFKKRYEILIDINGYKEDRYVKVVEMAKRVAKSVVRTKTNATLDHLPNDERKMVHQALSDMKYIRTESIGERNDRRLQIIYDPNKQ